MLKQAFASGQPLKRTDIFTTKTAKQRVLRRGKMDYPHEYRKDWIGSVSITQSAGRTTEEGGALAGGM